jgi:hypothetical protein
MIAFCVSSNYQKPFQRGLQGRSMAMNSAGGAAGRAWTKQSVGAVQLQAGIGGAMGWTEHKR